MHITEITLDGKAEGERKLRAQPLFAGRPSTGLTHASIPLHTCLAGFKSYAQRVTVQNFDPQFNAITGLNGSGKSNILDSICFVLGISNLSHVRAANMQELIYKQGQAGVTKASVSITFNNQDKSKSPIGYEENDSITVTRQIEIGQGKNKYMINGKKVDQSRVQNLFHSVQLNVNNPHFLIMQGRITKVLNAKPLEILSMLEEATGTRMYETKKEASLKQMEKKDAKLKEIDSVLSECIEPALQKLRREQATYLEWQADEKKITQLKQLIVAHEYMERAEMVNDPNGRIARQEATIKEKEERLDDLVGQLAGLDADISALEQTKTSQESGQLKEFTQAFNSKSKDLVKETSQLTALEKRLKEEGKALDKITKQLADIQRADPEAQLARATLARDETQRALAEARGCLTAAERELEGAESGDGRDESNRSMQERLDDAQRVVKEAESSIRAVEIRTKNLEKELAAAQKALVTVDREAQEMERRLEGERAKVAACEQALTGLRFDEAHMMDLEQQRDADDAVFRQLRDKARRLEDQARWTHFEYTDPEPRFDRSRVRGVVGGLFRVKDARTALALEVAGGGKLYNVVVDTEITGKLLLQKGNLRNRVTVIPMNKVDGRGVSRAEAQRMVQLTGGKAALATDLIEYPAELDSSMRFVFGNVFICDDAATARRVMSEAHVRCVTLEGDDMSPSGLLTGGHRGGSSTRLANLMELQTTRAEAEGYDRRLREITAQLQGYEAKRTEFNRLSSQLHAARNNLGVFEEKMKGSVSHQRRERVAELQTELASGREQLQEAQSKRAAAQQEAQSLQREIADWDKNRERRIKECRGKVDAAKKAIGKAEAVNRQAEQSFMDAEADIEATLKQKQDLEDERAKAEATVAGLSGDLVALRGTVAALKGEVDLFQGKMTEIRQMIQECDREINHKVKERSKRNEQQAGLQGELSVARKALQDMLVRDFLLVLFGVMIGFFIGTV